MVRPEELLVYLLCFEETRLHFAIGHLRLLLGVKSAQPEVALANFQG